MKFLKAFVLLTTRKKQTISKDKKQSLVSKVALTLHLLSPSTLAQCDYDFGILPFSVTLLTFSWKLIRKFDKELGGKHNIQCCDKVLLYRQMLTIHSNRKQLPKMTEDQLKRVFYKFQLSKHVLVCKWMDNLADQFLPTVLTA